MSERAGFVALVGRPSVGKSTLLNKLIGEKIAIVSRRAQTTRNQVRGILTRQEGQAVFIDTPGIHTPRHRLGEQMVQAARRAVADVDLALFVVDGAAGWGDGDEQALAAVQAAGVPSVLVVNKLDRPGHRSEATIAKATEHGEFVGVAEISAVSGIGLDQLVALVFAHLPEGPAFYPAEMTTDQSERFLVAETIREKVLQFTRDEVPHSVAVEIDKYDESDEARGLLRVAATIYVERESQKGIIIGKGGAMLKEIGSAARQDLETRLNIRFHLQLWVKVRENWRETPRALREFGYEEKE